MIVPSVRMAIRNIGNLLIVEIRQIAGMPDIARDAGFARLCLIPDPCGVVSRPVV